MPSDFQWTIDTLVAHIASDIGVSKKEAKEYLREALCRSLIVGEILDQIRFMRDEEGSH